MSSPGVPVAPETDPGSLPAVPPRDLPAALPLAELSRNPECPSVIMEYFLTRIREGSRPIAVSSLRTLAEFLRTEGLRLEDLRAGDVARLIEAHPAGASRRRGLLSFLKCLLGHLEVRGILDRNAAASVRHIRNPYRLGGVTPSLTGRDMERLLDSLSYGDPSDLHLLRDRALIALLRDSWGRIRAVCRARVSDLQRVGGRLHLRLIEKDTKIEMKEITAGAAAVLEEFLNAAPPAGPDGFIFRSGRGRGGRLSENPLQPRNAWDIITARARAAGLGHVHPHMLRVTGMNEFRRAGGSREEARRRMGHGSDGMVIYYERPAQEGGE
jgi:integrase